MRFLVTGANGFVGKSLCRELLAQGYIVRAALRSHRLDGAGFEQEVVATVDGATDWSAVLADVDIVVHLAARVHVMNEHAVNPLSEFRKVNVDGTLNLATQAAYAGVKRFIFMSSIKVNGEYTLTGKPFTEADVACPQDAYSLSKLEAEQGLLQIAQQQGLDVVIIRPPLIYGAGVAANFLSMMRALQQGIPLPLAAINNKRSLIYVGNLVDFILCCARHPAVKNQVFLVSDGRDLSTKELLCACADALKVKVRLFPVPKKILEWIASFLCKGNVVQRICGNLQVDMTKARTLLGWTPPISIADGLKATVQGLNAK